MDALHGKHAFNLMETQRVRVVAPTKPNNFEPQEISNGEELVRAETHFSPLQEGKKGKTEW